MHHFGIEGTVAVQARQTLEETVLAARAGREASADSRRGGMGAAYRRRRRKEASGQVRGQQAGCAACAT